MPFWRALTRCNNRGRLNRRKRRGRKNKRKMRSFSSSSMGWIASTRNNNALLAHLVCDMVAEEMVSGSNPGPDKLWQEFTWKHPLPILQNFPRFCAHSHSVDDTTFGGGLSCHWGGVSDIAMTTQQSRSSKEHCSFGSSGLRYILARVVVLGKKMWASFRETMGARQKNYKYLKAFTIHCLCTPSMREKKSYPYMDIYTNFPEFGCGTNYHVLFLFMAPVFRLLLGLSPVILSHSPPAWSWMWEPRPSFLEVVFADDNQIFLLPR